MEESKPDLEDACPPPPPPDPVVQEPGVLALTEYSSPPPVP